MSVGEIRTYRSKTVQLTAWILYMHCVLQVLMLMVLMSFSFSTGESCHKQYWLFNWVGRDLFSN